jgi:hypothetical protein
VLKRSGYVFIGYVIFNLLYYIVIQELSVDYMILNQVSLIFILCLHLGAILVSIIVLQNEDPNKKFIRRLMISVIYLTFLYVFLRTQIFMLK